MEPATALLWTYYFLAHHHDQTRQLQRAMEYVDKGLEHTPLLIELYVLKAKIYKVFRILVCVNGFRSIAFLCFNHSVYEVSIIMTSRNSQ